MWRHLAKSLQGPSHVADGSPCQDSHVVRSFGEGDHTLLACVADGAGSAALSDVGSALACKTILEAAGQWFDEHGHFEDFGEIDAAAWCQTAQDCLFVESIVRDCDCRQLATTLSVAIVGPRRSHFFQIGDGVIVLGNSNLFGVVFWPQSGEYANSTNFLSSNSFLEHLEFISVEGQWPRVALMTDGLERLALHFESRTPHRQFFAPLFAALESAAEVAALEDGFAQFLGSESIQQRSDDDKTLVLAARR